MPKPKQKPIAIPDSMPLPESAEDLARGLFKAADIKLEKKLADEGRQSE